VIAIAVPKAAKIATAVRGPSSCMPISVLHNLTVVRSRYRRISAERSAPLWLTAGHSSALTMRLPIGNNPATLCTIFSARPRRLPGGTRASATMPDFKREIHSGAYIQSHGRIRSNITTVTPFLKSEIVL